MALKEHRVKMLKIRLYRVGDLRRGRRSVRSDRYAAKRDDRFGHDRLRQGNPRDREGRREGRMRMDNRTNVRSLLINPHVHLNLGGGSEALVCLQNIAGCVNLADKFRRHKALGNTCRRAEKLIVIELNGDISVICRYHVAVIYPLTYI